jgi:hypothetical protein
LIRNISSARKRKGQPFGRPLLFGKVIIPIRYSKNRNHQATHL